MTKRETFLVQVLGMTVLGVGVLWGCQLYLDEVSHLDQRFASLQKEASQIQSKLVAQPVTNNGATYTDRFWEVGSLPEPLTLARSIKPVLDRSGVTIKDFQVVASTTQEFTLKYTLEGSASAFLGAAVELRTSDPKIIVHKLSAIAHERGVYSYEWEVGYASLP